MIDLWIICMSRDEKTGSRFSKNFLCRFFFCPAPKKKKKGPKTAQKAKFHRISHVLNELSTSKKHRPKTQKKPPSLSPNLLEHATRPNFQFKVTLT
jgi:hypothetical protein